MDFYGTLFNIFGSPFGHILVYCGVFGHPFTYFWSPFCLFLAYFWPIFGYPFAYFYRFVMAFMVTFLPFWGPPLVTLLAFFGRFFGPPFAFFYGWPPSKTLVSKWEKNWPLFWPFLVIFGHFRVILAIFWQFSVILGQVIWCWYYCHHLDHFPKYLGPFLAILGHFWPFWVILGHFRVILAIFGNFWPF